jgi:hypothetical protein
MVLTDSILTGWLLLGAILISLPEARSKSIAQTGGLRKMQYGHDAV